MAMKLKREDYLTVIKNALNEDLKEYGDVTSEPIFNKEKSSFVLVSKDDGILCGVQVFADVFKFIDVDCKIELFYKDCDKIQKNDIVAKIEGKIVNILKAERVALNFISHLSGIATKSAIFVKEAGDRLKILDTRKTIPGLRVLQKYAVYCGGGMNHRMGLFDMVLIKDNHIDAAGGMKNAVEKIRSKWGDKYKIEVETRTLDEVKEALACGVDRIMLDNMTQDVMREAVELIGEGAETEASGNVTLKRLKDIAATGVDYVSIGELTHTITPMDFSLKKEL